MAVSPVLALSYVGSDRQTPCLRRGVALVTDSEQKPEHVCSDCGMSLDLKQWQINWVIEHGNPVPRPPCPKNGNGLHRVANPEQKP